MEHVHSYKSNHINTGIQEMGLLWVFSDYLCSLGLLVIVCCFYFGELFRMFRLLVVIYLDYLIIES